MGGLWPILEIYSSRPPVFMGHKYIVNNSELTISQCTMVQKWSAVASARKGKDPDMLTLPCALGYINHIT